MVAINTRLEEVVDIHQILTIIDIHLETLAAYHLRKQAVMHNLLVDLDTLAAVTQAVDTQAAVTLVAVTLHSISFLEVVAVEPRTAEIGPNLEITVAIVVIMVANMMAAIGTQDFHFAASNYVHHSEAYHIHHLASEIIDRQPLSNPSHLSFLC